MPHSQTMLRASEVAWRMSPEAPLETSSEWKPSAMRPPIVTMRLASASFFWVEYLSPSGRNIVAPRKGPRGMMVTLCNGWVCGSTMFR